MEIWKEGGVLKPGEGKKFFLRMEGKRWSAVDVNPLEWNTRRSGFRATILLKMASLWETGESRAPKARVCAWLKAT
jgi:hypothetical protein